MFVREMSVSSSILKYEMSVGTTILSFPWTFPSQELVMVVSELHSPFAPVVGCSDPEVDTDVVVSDVGPVG